MSDDELAFWGEYGRRVTPDSLRMVPHGGGDILSLWNAFGALEAKVRANESGS